MVTGPGATLGNLPLSIETHVDWITDCIAAMRRDGHTTIEPAPAAQKEWSEHVDSVAGGSMISRADSWYNGSNIPGKARAYVFYFGHFGRYRQRLLQVADDGYTGFVLSS